MGILAAGPLTLAVVLTNAGAPFAASNAPSIRLQSRERSRPQDGESERSLRESIRRGNDRPHRSTGCLARAGNSKSSEPDRSLWPSFWRTPAPRSRLRTRHQSAFRAASEAVRRTARASGPCANPYAAGTNGPTAALVALPEQGIRNPRSQTAHSGRRSGERRRPVRGSERAINPPSAPRERAVPARIHPPRERAAPPQHGLPCQSREFEILGARPLTPAVVLANAGPVRGSEPIPRAFSAARASGCCRDPRFRLGGGTPPAEGLACGTRARADAQHGTGQGWRWGAAGGKANVASGL